MDAVKVPLKGFIKSGLQNGVGRFVIPLQRVTIKFCKTNPISKGVRDYIESESVDFARKYPSVVLYLKPRRNRTPVIKAEYLNGHDDWLPMANFTRDEVAKWMNYVVNRSGYPLVKYQKDIHTDTPSIQGVWTPFTNTPTEFNIHEFPAATTAWNEAINTNLSATEIVRKMAEVKHPPSNYVAEEEDESGDEDEEREDNRK